MNRFKNNKKKTNGDEMEMVNYRYTLYGSTIRIFTFLWLYTKYVISS